MLRVRPSNDGHLISLEHSAFCGGETRKCARQIVETIDHGVSAERARPNGRVAIRHENDTGESSGTGGLHIGDAVADHERCRRRRTQLLKNTAHTSRVGLFRHALLPALNKAKGMGQPKGLQQFTRDGVGLVGADAESDTRFARRVAVPG